MNEPDAAPDETAPAPDVGVFAGHALAYADLVTALLHAWQASLQRKLVGALLAAAGLGICTLMLTVGVVAAAWDTPYRWLTLLLVSGAYLLLGALGLWLLSRRPAVPEPMSVLADELRKDATLLAAVLRERAR